MKINLAQDIHAVAYNENQVVHEREQSQAQKIIKQLIGHFYDAEIIDDKPLIRRHNTITISGDRGSGKTSFLLTLLQNNELKENVEILQILDPTLMEEKGHVLLNVIAQIQAKIEYKFSKDNVNLDNKKRWDEQLNKLAFGLPMLDGIDGGLDPKEWNDPTFVMKDGLRRVGGANNFERHFHKFIEMSLKILGKETFIISFDDVDTDFSKGWPVLETLRKYLTSPQIITILSGDLGLYSMLIRKKQWGNFGKSLLKNEYDKEIEEFPNSHYIDYVAKLESQYTLKVLKPEYRIMLSTIAAKLQQKQIIEVQEDEGDKPIGIEKYYHNKLKKVLGISGAVISDLYVKFFTALPLRSQISTLRALKEENNITKNIFDIFYTEVKSMGINGWDLTNNYGLTNIHILKFLLDNKILDEGSQFIPKTGDLQINSTLVALGAVFSERASNNSFEIFDHIIRVSNIVSKADSWELAPDEDNIKNKPYILNYVAHSRCLYDYGLQKTASLQSAYIASFKEVERVNNGLIPIKALRESTKQGATTNDPRFDDIFQRYDGRTISDYLGYIPLMAVQNQLGYSSLFYSFYNIIATIGDLLSVKDLGADEVGSEFDRMAHLRYYPAYFNTNSTFDISDEEGRERGKQSNDTTKNGNDTTKQSKEQISVLEFVQEFLQWNSDNALPKIPPYLIGRIMVRTAFSFDRIDQLQNIAELIHRQVVCFLNAILVEEIMENDGTAKLILTNPTNSDKVFTDNYNKNKTNLPPLFKYISSCPLILSYLDPTLLTELGITSSNNIYTELSLIKVDYPSTNAIKKDHSVKAITNDIKILKNYFDENNISKDDALTDKTLKAAILACFTNKKRPRQDVFDKIKKLISESWN